MYIVHISRLSLSITKDHPHIVGRKFKLRLSWYSVEWLSLLQSDPMLLSHVQSLRSLPIPKLPFEGLD